MESKRKSQCVGSHLFNLRSADLRSVGMALLQSGKKNPMTMLDFNKHCPQTEGPLQAHETLLVFSHFPLLGREHIKKTELSTAVYTLSNMGVIY